MDHLSPIVFVKKKQKQKKARGLELGMGMYVEHLCKISASVSKKRRGNLDFCAYMQRINE